MTTLIRIPMGNHTGKRTCIDDLDLHALMLESGGPSTGRIDLQARGRSGRPMSAQWLEGSRPSALPGHRRGSLLLEGCGEGEVEVLVASAGGQAKEGEIVIGESADALSVAVQGKPFADYRYNTKDPEVRRPFFHPIIGPSGKPITQMGEVPGKKEKHFHHTALWIAHQNWSVPGQAGLDNWQMNKGCTRIEHVKFDSVQSGAMAARFVERLHWLDKTGDKVLVAEARTVTIPSRSVIDIDLSLQAKELPVTFNRTPYHLLACRVLDEMLPAKGGTISNSDGKKNPPDGAAAQWIDISGPLEGKVQGVALFNHPANVRQPTPCLQFSGQTIGLSPSHKEPMTIEPGKELRFRFRVLIHPGNVEEGKVAGEYEAYAKEGKSMLGKVEVIRG